MAEGLTGDAIKEVERIAREAAIGKDKELWEVRTIGGESYVNKELKHLPKLEPGPGPLGLSTLQGLVDYVRAGFDAKFTDGRNGFVLINSPTSVQYGFGADGPYLRRSFVVVCDAEVPEIAFGQKMGIEAFLTSLRTLYVQTPAIQQLIDWFSKIDSTQAITLSENGMSQQLVINKGVRGAESVKIPNPIPLQPFRTFAQVTQPESPFFIRLHDGDPTRAILPTVSVTEADMGQWVLAATKNIKDFLRDSLPEGSVILG